MEWKKDGRIHILNIEGIVIKVHNYAGCGEQWFLTSYPLEIECKAIHENDLEAAKIIAIDCAKNALKAKIKQYQKAVEIIEEIN